MLRTTLAALSLFGVAAVANASTFTPVSVNSLVLTVSSLDATSTVLGFDVRGTAPGLVDALGQVFVTDGQPLGVPAPSFPNGSLLIFSQSLTQSGVLAFDIPVVGGAGLLQTATFTPNTSITDPALAAFVDFPPLTFEWELTGLQPGQPLNGNLPTTLSTWALLDATSASAVPEPASLALIGLGLLGCGVLRKKGRKY